MITATSIILKKTKEVKFTNLQLKLLEKKEQMNNDKIRKTNVICDVT